MITLNLIPDKVKKDLKIYNAYIATKNIIFLALTGTIIIAITLLGAKYVLNNYFNKTVNENYLNVGIGKFTITEIREFKQDLREIIIIQNEYRSWLDFLSIFSNLVNNGVLIESITADKQGQVNLAGTAADRNSLMNFKDNLENSGQFEKFEIPLNLLFKKENIVFNFKLKFNWKKL